MPKYLLEVSYTLEGVKGLKAEGGSARVAAVREATEAGGGRLESMYFAFGENDVYIIVDFPDNATAAGAALAVSATGAAKVRTVVLLTPAEVDAAVKVPSTYRPPRS
ncbi:MAG TPA: GYD domain-containing protein [Acidimicrobiales bacterium]|nr:GYD domain-containing protein [Acidimicrobiales bacterium]